MIILNLIGFNPQLTLLSFPPICFNLIKNLLKFISTKPSVMKKLIIFLLLITCIAPAQSKGKTTQPRKSTRIEKTINSQWTFNYFPEGSREINCESPAFDDSKWPLVSVPHTWSTFETTGELHPFIKSPSEKDNPYWWTGWGWYRKHFQVNTDITNKKVFIEFEGVQKYCKVWINGKYLGDHKGGYGSFDFDITDHVAKGKDNILVVAVSNKQNDEFNIPPMAAGDFNVYGGIYRDVTLVVKDKLYIPMQGSASHEGGTFVTTPVVSDKQGIVRVQTWVKNDYSQPKNCILNTYIIDAANKVIQVLKTKYTINPKQLYRFDQTFKPVKNPHLWSPETPYIYKVWSEVTDGSIVTDSYTTPLGFRWFRWDYKENLLYINDKKSVIQGGNRQQEYPWLGDAVPEWITEMDFKDINENLKYNFIRTAHYPNDKYVYDLADKYGMVIDEESPTIKNQPFSPGVQEQQMKEMIRRDRNHPSIMFWGIGTDTDHPVNPQYALSEDTTRILTAARVVNIANTPAGLHSFEDMAKENVITDIYPVPRRRFQAAQGLTAGEPAKIVLTGSSMKMTADLSSIAIITADIVDPKGNHVKGANNTMRWTVSGPATFVGPQISVSDAEQSKETNGVWYLEVPVSNVIRSTGKAGKIRITVSASGLASGSFEIDVSEVKSASPMVAEPVLDEKGRTAVAKPFFSVSRLDDIPREINLSNDDITMQAADRNGYAAAIKGHILKNNPAIDTATVEFRSMISIFASHLNKNQGLLGADDFNFNADHYNNCRLISGYINATKLPPLFKETLRNYYADAIIARGNEKNPGDEMNWLNWIPSGGIVIVSQDVSIPAWPKGTVITNKTALYDLITTVYPVFDRYSDDAKLRALTFISKMNPYITAKEVGVGDAAKMTYTAEKGKPILIPLIKFISE